MPIVGGAMSGSMLDPSVLSGVAFSNGSGDTNTFYGSPPGLRRLLLLAVGARGWSVLQRAPGRPDVPGRAS